MFYTRLFCLLGLATTLSAPALGCSHPSAHAPIGVMGDHTHEAGTGMLSYRYMFMEMDGNRDGTDRVSTANVLETFRVSPTRMTLEMHMLGGKYAPTDDLTMMVMLPLTRFEMDHVTRMGGRFTTESEGVGDLKTTALIKVFDQGHHKAHLNAGISFSTGSIDEKNNTPMGRVRLPYPMQLGSGTYDLLPGLTYLGHGGNMSWGGQVLGTIRLDENDNDYTLGGRVESNIWGARNWSAWFSNLLRLSLER